MMTLSKRIIAMAVLVGVAAAAVPAAADGRQGEDRSYHPSFWQGMYAGVHLGHGELGPLDGFVGGAQIGYNWQKGQIVYGWEADVTLSDVSWEHFGISAQVDWMATARGRLGFLLHPNYLAYVTAGLGVAHVEVSNGFYGIDDTGTDFVLGLGIEGKLTETSTLRVEYLGFDDLDVIRAGLNFKLGK